MSKFVLLCAHIIVRIGNTTTLLENACRVTNQVILTEHVKKIGYSGEE